MNKGELIAKVAEENGETKACASRFLDCFLDNIRAELIGGGEVTLVGFGTFRVVDTAARTGRNPSTGEPLQIPAGKRVKFSPGKSLKGAFKED